MWGSTERAVGILAETLASEGVEVRPLNLAKSNLGDLAGELVDSAGLVVGTPTVLGGVHPKLHNVLYLAGKLKPPAPLLGAVESHGWSGGALGQVAEMVEPLDGEVVGTVAMRGPPDEGDAEALVELGRDLARRVGSMD